MQWHPIAVGPSELFPAAHHEDDADVESAGTPSETDQDFLTRTLLQAANDQHSHESGSSTPEHAHAPEQAVRRPPNPQKCRFSLCHGALLLRVWESLLRMKSSLQTSASCLGMP